MNESNAQPVPVQELLALLGQKELEIYMLRKALAQLQQPQPIAEPPGDNLGPLAHHPV